MTKKLLIFVLLICGLSSLHADERLKDTIGLREVRIFSAPFELRAGRTVQELQLVERLERLGYRRVREKPQQPGTFFWAYEAFWIFQRRCVIDGKERDPELWALQLRKKDGMILGALDENGILQPDKQRFLEGELLAESFKGNRAIRVPIDFENLPEHVWRPLLAAEDARFFDHIGLDGKALARSLYVNLKEGEVKQGGSTITQQLIKNRDLTPERSLGRKAKEALRAVKLEATYPKKEILEAYLDSVYLGHMNGLALHGYGLAAKVFFNKSAADLSLLEAATLAAMVQGPNRLAPHRNPEIVRERRDWVLDRMQDLNWESASTIESLKQQPIKLDQTRPRGHSLTPFLSWIQGILNDKFTSRMASELGFRVETGMDAVLQDHAEAVVGRHLRDLRSRFSKGKRDQLSIALVAMDANNGDVLAYIAADPNDRDDRFDRVRSAMRQPGSTVKPMILLAAFESGRGYHALHPASRVEDSPFTLDLPSGSWSPKNNDGRFHGVVTVGTALKHSYNVPFAKIGQYVGVDNIADHFAELGVQVPKPVPPAVVLGAIELSPLQLARAYSALINLGEVIVPRPIRVVEKPGGWRLKRYRAKDDRVRAESTSYVVHQMLRQQTEAFWSSYPSLKNETVGGKTGTSNDGRDAWFAGFGNGVVCVVWVGLDNSESTNLTGTSAALPIWRDFMAQAVPSRPLFEVEQPRGVFKARVDLDKGLRLPDDSRKGQLMWFRTSVKPGKTRWWWPDDEEPIIR